MTPEARRLYAAWQQARQVLDASANPTDAQDAAEQDAWGAWADHAEDHGLCLRCGVPSPTRAYCPACDARLDNQ